MPGARPRGRWTETWTAPALVAAVAALVWAPSLFGAFVWDDHRFIEENPAVASPASWTAFFTDAGTADSLGAAGIVRPLRTFEFALDHALFGDRPFWFHLHSLAWHVAAAALLFCVLRRLLGDGRAALVAALFWALHPSQSEAVAFVSSRDCVAAAACVFASVLFALRSRGFDRDFAFSLAVCFVAMLYKETAVAAPIVFFALWLTDRVKPRFAWPWFAVAGLYFVYRAAVETSFSQQAPFLIGGSVAGTFATMFRAFGFYVAQSLLPAPAFEWYLSPSRSLLDFAALAWLLAHLALFASAIALRRRAPLWTLAVAWFYAFLLPVANWPVNLGIPTTERWLCLPLAGVALAVGVGVARVGRAAFVAVLAGVAAFAASSLARERTWRNEDDLWSATLADHPSARGDVHFATRLQTDAVELASRAAKMAPGEARSAVVADAKRIFEEALDHAHRAIAQRYAFEGERESRTDLTALAEKLAADLSRHLLRPAEALFHVDESIRIRPNWWGAHYVRAFALLDLGFAPRAVEEMRVAWQMRGSPRDRETADFFLRAAKGCDEAGLLATAETAYAAAIGVATPGGPLADEAGALLDALRKKPRPADAAKFEAESLARMDDALAKLPRSCPARPPQVTR